MLKNKISIVIITVLFIGACALGGWFFATRNGATNTDDNSGDKQVTETTSAGNVLDSDSDADEMGSTVKINGQVYRYNNKLKTLLFMGVDTESEVKVSDMLGSGGRADVIMLFIIDEEQKTIKVLEISRDSMVTVDAYDHDRKLLFSGTMQINMQYAFSDSHARSCTLMKRKVSDVLYGVKINSYLSLTMDGISVAADAMGGLQVTMNRDWTEIQENYTEGTTVVMNGEEAERFIRYRDINELGSNDTRMERHAYLLKQMVAQIKRQSTAELTNLLEKLEPCMESDMDGETIKKLASYQLEDEVLKVPGQTVAGENHDEFYIDETELQKLILELFYVVEN